MSPLLAIQAIYTVYYMCAGYTSETHVALQELGPGTNYRLSVASIASNGEMSDYSDGVNFANVMATQGEREREFVVVQC